VFDHGLSSASEVTTLWRYTNLFIIIIIIYLRAHGLRKVDEQSAYTPHVTFHLCSVDKRQQCKKLAAFSCHRSYSTHRPVESTEDLFTAHEQQPNWTGLQQVDPVTWLVLRRHLIGCSETRTVGAQPVRALWTRAACVRKLGRTPIVEIQSSSVQFIHSYLVAINHLMNRISLLGLCINIVIKFFNFSSTGLTMFYWTVLL